MHSVETVVRQFRGATAMRISNFLVGIFCAPIVTLYIHAQVPTGSVAGLVTDPKHAVISGASVTLISASQGFTRQTITNKDGLYVLSDLPSGQYALKIEQPGFAVSDFPQMVIEAGRAT